MDKRPDLDLKYDGVIIVSGPSGTSEAKALSGPGLKTIILEKVKLPRYKMCGGVLSPSSAKFIVDHFGEIRANVISKPVEVIGACIYTGLDDRYMDIPFASV